MAAAAREGRRGGEVERRGGRGGPGQHWRVVGLVAARRAGGIGEGWSGSGARLRLVAWTGHGRAGGEGEIERRRRARVTNHRETTRCC